MKPKEREDEKDSTDDESVLALTSTVPQPRHHANDCQGRYQVDIHRVDTRNKMVLVSSSEIKR